VIGMIEGSDPVLKNEAIIIGAHLDHLGLNDQLMPGANDNASSVASLLGAARSLAQSGVPLKRTVVFILFAAEEQGVKGSEYYVAHPVVPNAKVKAMLNLEGVGHGDRIGCSGGGGDYSEVSEALTRNNTRFVHRPLSVRATANLARPRQDAAHFMWANIPTINIGASGGPDIPVATYHTTHDTPEFITPEIMEDIARLIYLSVVDLANGGGAIATR
jgi:Zn-dependent M28 family amino/carboxypeptidase